MTEIHVHHHYDRPKNQRFGCAGTLVVLVLLGLSIEYWYVTVPVLAVILVTSALIAYGSRVKRVAPQAPAQRAQPPPARRCHHCGAPGQGAVCAYCRSRTA